MLSNYNIQNLVTYRYFELLSRKIVFQSIFKPTMAFLLFRFFNLKIKFDLCKNVSSIFGWRLHLYLNQKLVFETYVLNICFFVIDQCILVIFSLLVFSTLRFFLFQESVGTPSNQPDHNQHNHSENGKYPPIRNETRLLKMVLIYYP